MLIGGLTSVDAVLLIVLIGFAVWGFGNGFIRAIGGILGIIVAAAVSSRYYLWFSGIIAPLFGSFQALAPVVSFTVLFLLVGRLFGILVGLFEKAFDIIAFIPFLKTINRLAGLVFGLLLGAFFAGVLLLVIGKYSQWTGFNTNVEQSELARLVLRLSEPLKVFYPQNFLDLRSYF